jgi:hypothetical protein
MITVSSFLLTCSRRRFTEQQADTARKEKGVRAISLRLAGPHISFFLPAAVYFILFV